MAVITMDGLDQPPNPRGAFRIRNVRSVLVDSEAPKTPTRLGYYLLSAMKEAGYARVARFAAAAGVAGSTMHRVIYGGSGRPDVDTLRRIAEALAGTSLSAEAPEGEKADYQRAVEQIHQELLAEAGYSIGVTPPSHTLDPVALKLDDAIGERSKLSENDRELLRTMVDRLIDDTLRRRRKRAG